MTTVHILTKNNSTTIRQCLDSISRLDPRILVADLGSTDDTIPICREYKAEIHPFRGKRNEARNRLSSLSEGMSLWIEPWETFVQGDIGDSTARATIVQGKILNQEVRIWKGKAKFVNPVFERMDVAKSVKSSVCLLSKGRNDLDEMLLEARRWQEDEPMSSAPIYCISSLLLAQGKQSEFLSAANQYLFLDRTSDKSLMTRYYHAMVTMFKGDHRQALQNLNLCLCRKPLMAEFWCLMADVYYHLLHKFDHASQFYQNAMFLGSRRKQDSLPMDVSKYREYPKMMIESCDKIIKNTSYFSK